MKRSFIGLGQAGALLIALALFLTIMCFRLLAVSDTGQTVTKVSLSKSAVDAAYGKLPLSFEANQGQTDGRVKFVS